MRPRVQPIQRCRRFPMAISRGMRVYVAPDAPCWVWSLHSSHRPDAPKHWLETRLQGVRSSPGREKRDRTHLESDDFPLISRHWRHSDQTWHPRVWPLTLSRVDLGLGIGSIQSLRDQRSVTQIFSFLFLNFNPCSHCQHQSVPPSLCARVLAFCKAFSKGFWVSILGPNAYVSMTLPSGTW